MDGRHLDTRHVETASELVTAIEAEGLEPLADPRELTRQAAKVALDRLFDHSIAEDFEHDLRIVARLLATIITINGPGEERKH